MSTLQNQQVRVDKFVLAEKILQAQNEENVPVEELNNLISLYEESIAKDIRKNKYTASIIISKNQRELLRGTAT